MADHGDLNGGHDLSTVDSENSEAEDAIVFAYQSFHEPACFRESTRAEIGGRGNFEQAIGDVLFLCFGLAQSDVCHLWISEQGEGNLSASGDAAAAGEVVTEDAEVVEGDVCELRTTGYFAVGPNAGCRGFELFVHLDVATVGQLDSCELEADAVGVRRPPCGDEDSAHRPRQAPLLLRGRFLSMLPSPAQFCFEV